MEAAPIAQEQHQNDGGQKQSDQDSVAHALDGLLHQIGLIVERCQRDAFGKRFANAVDLGMNLVGHLDRIAFRLAIDIQQNGRISIGLHDGIDRFYGRLHRSEIADAHGNAGRSGFHDDIGDLGCVVYLAAHQAQHQLMIGLHQPR